MAASVLAGIGVPAYRQKGYVLHTSERYMEGKREDDGIDRGLWRVHGALYDLSMFDHPGGRSWLEMTRGTDVTEAFETHHLNIKKARAVLAKYKVRDIDTPRRSPYTFAEGSFYCTLRERVRVALEKQCGGVSGTTPATRALADGLAALFAVLVVTLGWRSFAGAAAAGVVLGLLGVVAHNFFHQKDAGNFRRFYFDLSCLSSHEWRISHALSHHQWPNSLHDIEVAGVEPFYAFLPTPSKNFVQRKLVFLYGLFVVNCIVAPEELLKRFYFIARGGQALRWENFLVFVPLLAMRLSLTHFLVMHVAFSWVFVTIGLAAAHHHPECWHDGDAPHPAPTADFGVAQIDAVRDRRDFVDQHVALVTMMYGNHTLHHLFPTIDHGKLWQLEPQLEECQQEFFVPRHRAFSQTEMFVGQWRQCDRLTTRGSSAASSSKKNE